MIKNFLNLEGHQNPIIGSNVTAILLKGWISPIGGASAVEGLRSTGLPRLVIVAQEMYCMYLYLNKKMFWFCVGGIFGLGMKTNIEVRHRTQN